MEYSKVLLTIGNDEYEGNWTALKGAVSDSRKIGNHCRECGDWMVHSWKNVTEAEFKSAARQASSEITMETSVVAFHYSGHAVESQGKTWLIPVVDKEDTDKKDNDNKVHLDTLLEALCKNVSPNAKLIVLIDGCRTEVQDKETSLKPPPIHCPPRCDFLQFYACLPGSSAHEKIDLGSGCARGRFSMVLLKCMQECESLASLIGQVMQEVEKFKGFKQKTCIYSSWEPSFSSTPNFFKKKLHVVKHIEIIQTAAHSLDRTQDDPPKSAEKDVEECTRQLQEKQEEVDELTSQKRQLEEECRQLEEEKRRLEEERRRLEEDKDTNQAEISRLSDELAETSRKLEEKERELKGKESELAKAFRKLREQEQELKDKKSELEHFQRMLDTRDKRIKEAEDARTELQHKIARLASEPQESNLQLKQERDVAVKERHVAVKERDNLREENSKLSDRLRLQAHTIYRRIWIFLNI